MKALHTIAAMAMALFAAALLLQGNERAAALVAAITIIPACLAGVTKEKKGERK